MGSNGEFASLNFEERKRVIELFSNENQKLKNKKMIIASTGGNVVNDVLKLNEFAYEKDCDFCMVVTPHYYLNEMVKEKTQIDYFEYIASNSKLPVIIYCIPQYTSVNLSPKTISVLSKHSNIAGMKDRHFSFYF